MVRDPRSDREKPAPAHPQGLRPADDAPVFVAPPVDVRPSSPARTSAPPPGPEIVPSNTGEVPFTLPFPAEEKTLSEPPPALDEPPSSLPPETVDWDRISARYPEVPGTRTRPELRREPLVTIDTAADADERDAIVRDLTAIGGLDERPDRTIERAVAQRATLARARALRFRLSLIDGWVAANAAPDSSTDIRSLQLDLSIDAMLIVAIANGSPSLDGPSTPLPAVRVMVEALRGIRSDLPRTTLRDRGAAAIARLTIVGYRPALEQLGKAATAAPPDARRLALDLAARVALVPSIDEHRLGALQDLERALQLSTGSVAPAIESARRRLAARR